ncbi:hypothetical protein FA15DRAFT_665845 [Coprinopsis marcescibilis]|uniref:50S ribosomal protein L35 n=1 Tax=Coprinopsis marcescibilis TaxID=230819 RepID=A0A5C3L608_COPMA|nr:hypothetical protein FA15DRAFT_665845 [Coprinopsis marcescibilis]
MFAARLAQTCQSCLRSSSSLFSANVLQRSLFSTSPVAEAGYKMKSHSGAKKRWRSVGSTFKRAKAGHSHLNEHKSASRKNQLGGTAYATSTQATKLRKRLLPYGSA